MNKTQIVLDRPPFKQQNRNTLCLCVASEFAFAYRSAAIRSKMHKAQIVLDRPPSKQQNHNTLCLCIASEFAFGHSMHVWF
jgi:hypothetical protein